MTALKYIVGAGDHGCPDGVYITALKYITSVVLRRGAPKSLLHRHVDNNVDISEQFKGYTWWEVRIARDNRGARSGEGYE